MSTSRLTRGAEALLGVRQAVMVVPGVRHAAAERDHALEHGDLALQRLLRIAGQSRGLPLQGSDELMALLRQQLDALADKSRLRRCWNARASGLGYSAFRLHVILAVAAGPNA